MSELHAIDLLGAYPLCRDRLVAETRTLHADFAATTWADSRLRVDQAGVLELLRQTASTFAIVPMGESLRAERADDAADARAVTFSFLFVIAQWVTDGNGEDLFFNRVGEFTLGWAERDTLEVTVAGRVLPFLVSVEEAAPLALGIDEAGDVRGHATTVRIVLEVEACAT
jgi:hypothetical protein